MPRQMTLPVLQLDVDFFWQRSFLLVENVVRIVVASTKYPDRTQDDDHEQDRGCRKNKIDLSGVYLDDPWLKTDYERGRLSTAASFFRPIALIVPKTIKETFDANAFAF